MTEQQDQQAAALKQINDSGATRFGKENWETSLRALENARPRHVDPAAIIQAAAATGDAAGALHKAGIDALISQADVDDDARRKYAAIREAQRAEFRKMRGR